MWPPSSEDSLLARTTIAIAFQRTIERRRAGDLGLLLGRDRVDVGRVEGGDRAGAGGLSPLDDARENVPRALRPVVGHDRIERLEPFARLDGVDIGSRTVGR